MIAKQTVFLTGDRSEAVPEGHKDAKFLLVREGSMIEDALAEKHNAVALVDTPAKKKPVEPQQQQAPVLKGDATASDVAPSAPAKAPKAKKAPKSKK
jgi:hypothetical protein